MFTFFVLYYSCSTSNRPCLPKMLINPRLLDYTCSPCHWDRSGMSDEAAIPPEPLFCCYMMYRFSVNWKSCRVIELFCSVVKTLEKKRTWYGGAERGCLWRAKCMGKCVFPLPACLHVLVFEAGSLAQRPSKEMPCTTQPALLLGVAELSWGSARGCREPATLGMDHQGLQVLPQQAAHRTL